ncbi:hypothetical protein PR048_010761 [Dryococelus australis]|uniref:Uncharacterized protein n=1 Tax=Dryococelus australis TaxID=614101 RepID=A0ABQ9I4F4_9NEOP|nr:hypothetical protein PR048_010761 [Dryococelus australis]
MRGRGKRDTPEKTRRPAASSGRIPIYVPPSRTRDKVDIDTMRKALISRAVSSSFYWWEMRQTLLRMAAGRCRSRLVPRPFFSFASTERARDELRPRTCTPQRAGEITDVSLVPASLAHLWKGNNWLWLIQTWSDVITPCYKYVKQVSGLGIVLARAVNGLGIVLARAMNGLGIVLVRAVGEHHEDHMIIVPVDGAGRQVFSGSPVFPTLAFRRCSVITSFRPGRLSRHIEWKADETEVRCVWSSAGMQGRGKESGTMATCENPGNELLRRESDPVRHLAASSPASRRFCRTSRKSGRNDRTTLVPLRNTAMLTTAPASPLAVRDSSLNSACSTRMSKSPWSRLPRNRFETTSRYPIELAAAMLPDLPVFDYVFDLAWMVQACLDQAGCLGASDQLCSRARAHTHTVELRRYLRLERLPPLRPRRIGFNSRRGRSRIFALGNRGGRCRLLAGLLGDLPFTATLHSGVAPYPPRFTKVHQMHKLRQKYNSMMCYGRRRLAYIKHYRLYTQGGQLAQYTFAVDDRLNVTFSGDSDFIGRDSVPKSNARLYRGSVYILDTDEDVVVQAKTCTDLLEMLVLDLKTQVTVQ